VAIIHVCGACIKKDAKGLGMGRGAYQSVFARNMSTKTPKSLIICRGSILLCLGQKGASNKKNQMEKREDSLFAGLPRLQRNLECVTVPQLNDVRHVFCDLL